MSGEQWLSIKDVATALDKNEKTIRRWIKEGKLQAELTPGPYGDEYRIPADQIGQAQEIHDVVRVNNPVDMATLANVMSQYLSERETAIAEAMQSLRTELVQTRNELASAMSQLERRQDEGQQKLMERLDERESDHERRIKERDEQLTAALRALQEQAAARQQEKRKGLFGWMKRD